MSLEPAAAAAPAPWTGGSVAPWAHCVLAPNPNVMTLEGTNTWVLSRPGEDRAVVVDPGPDDAGHLQAVLDAVAARGARVGAVLLTHGHVDHSEGARRFAELAGVDAVHAFDPAFRLGDGGLADGDVIDVGGLRIDVVGAAGHSSDSVAFVVADEGALLTGDTVLGHGTTVVAYPDGQLGPYLDTLQRLRDRSATAGLDIVLPGHGPVLEKPVEVLEYYQRHRRQRLDQVRAAVEAGARTPRQVVEIVYADVDRKLWPPAELSVRAQLAYLGVAEPGPEG